MFERSLLKLQLGSKIGSYYSVVEAECDDNK